MGRRGGGGGGGLGVRRRVGRRGGWSLLCRGLRGRGWSLLLVVWVPLCVCERRHKGGRRGSAYSFIASNCDFLGRISSMKGSKPGYVSRNLLRRPRWAEDLTLDLEPACILY